VVRSSKEKRFRHRDEFSGDPIDRHIRLHLIRFVQTHELAKEIREDLRRVTHADWDPDDIPSDDEDYDDDEETEMGVAARTEVFERAWAAWNVAEESLLDDRNTFGAQSFGLIALGVLLEVVKDARSTQ
jgi:RNA-dependent RNA polymerase